MQVKVGDTVHHGEYGLGQVVAMSRDWCVFYSHDMLCELAVPWLEISVPCAPMATGEGLQVFDTGNLQIASAPPEVESGQAGQAQSETQSEAGEDAG